MTVANRVVVDASALASLVLPDEDGSRIARALSDARPIAPQLLWAEVRNVLLVAERKGRFGPGSLEGALEGIAALSLRMDVSPVSDRVVGLARQHGLTIYDALYLELALREGVALATFDKALMRAAVAEGVAVV